MSKVVNINDYRPAEPISDDDILKRLIEINAEIIELNKASMLNYVEYSNYLYELLDNIANKGEKDEWIYLWWLSTLQC